jgi:hypothetical protein
MRNVSDEVVKKIETRVLCSIIFSENRAGYEQNLENCGAATQATGGNKIRHKRFACWITKATDTHSEYVTLIAFPLQQWLRERAFFALQVHCLSCFFIWS